MRKHTYRRIVWVLFARLCTFIVPDIILKYIVGLPTAEARQAWREKITLCILLLGFGGFLLFWLEYLSTLFCDTEHTYEYNDVFKNDSKYVALNGKAIDWSHYTDSSSMAADVMQYRGLDVSPMFPTFMKLDRQGGSRYKDSRIQACIGDKNKSAQADNWLYHKLHSDPGYVYENNRLISCPLPDHPNITGAICYNWDYDLPSRGDIVYDMAKVHNYTTLSSSSGPGKAYVVLNNKVLDVTAYLETTTTIVEVSTNVYSRSFNVDRMFLPSDLTILLYINLGRDITPYLQGNVSRADDYVECLEALFFKGIIHEPESEGCEKINPALWATMGAGLLYFLFKMSLANLCRIGFMQRLLFSSRPEFSSTFEHAWAHTILMVPCYDEPVDILKQTIESLARTNYDDSKKLLLFVCDGLAQSSGSSKETHVCILELLGYSGTEDPTPQPYISLGQGRRKLNYAKVYSGYYEAGRNRVPYLVVVKTGGTSEVSVKCVPGNRGKRDSMVLVFGFLERCTNLANNRITPLEYELFNQCYSVLGIDPRSFKYVLVNDADIQVQANVIQKLVTRLEKDRKMLAISGHVRPANPEQNFTTMLQIFPLYQTLYSGLAFEAFLGTVLSINGGFVMYKIWTENVPDDEKRGALHVFRHNNSASTSQQTFHAQKWPKVSDEIMSSQDAWDQDGSVTTGGESRLSLSVNASIRPCCIHPTVLRGFAAPQADTLHMKNVLLLGEEQYLSIVLLQSHLHHRLGFEPEAIGYVTLPTNIFTLQALQSRNLRATFHNQIEMHRVALHLGISCWIVSLLKILDMIFSLPIIVYLYSVYIRYFIWRDNAYGIIVVSFTCLVGLHILYFIVRRQLKYVFWFLLYGIFAVPLFTIWFPLVAVWSSNYAEWWYDTWPSSNKRNSRLHGIIDDGAGDKEKEPSQQGDNSDASGKQEEPANDALVQRLRLGEYEAIEAEKSYQRAMQEAAALDSNFTGFTGIVGLPASVHTVSSRRSASLIESTIPSAPLIQHRGDYASTHTVTSSKGYKTIGSIRERLGVRKPGKRGKEVDEVELASTSAVSQSGSVHGGSAVNPFQSDRDNPFDDSYAASPVHFTEEQPRTMKHKQSHSQSSYFTHSTRATEEDALDYTTQVPNRSGTDFASIANTSGFTHLPRSDPLGHGRSYSAESVVPPDRCSIRSMASNTYSIASSNLSLDPEASLETTRYGFGMGDPLGNDMDVNEEGRSVAQHGKVGLRIPGHTNTRGAVYTTVTPLTQPARLHSTRRRRAPAIPTSMTSALPENNPGSFHPRNGYPGSTQSHRRAQTAQSASGGQDTIAELQTSIRQEIRSFLREADLDSTTRAQVKRHLFNQLGSSVQDDNLEDFINDCIEEITLELLT